jgi:hypothetical protein
MRLPKLSDEPKKIFLPTNVSCQFPNVELEVILSNDSAVGSSQPTERKTKNLRNIGLDDKTDLEKFDEANSSRRISKSSEATRSEQKEGTLARKNLIFEEKFTSTEKENIKRKIQENPFINYNYFEVKQRSSIENFIIGLSIRRKYTLRDGMMLEEIFTQEDFDELFIRPLKKTKLTEQTLVMN